MCLLVNISKRSVHFIYFCYCSLVIKSCLTLCNTWIVDCQAPLSMGIPRQEYWSGVPFPSSGNLSDPGIEPASSALASGFLIYPNMSVLKSLFKHFLGGNNK